MNKRIVSFEDFIAESAQLDEAKVWYLKARDNPQLGTYYKAGKNAITKGEFNKKVKSGSSGYGCNTYQAFGSMEELEDEFARLEAAGEKISWES